MGRGKRDCLENYVVKENCNNCADDGANDGNGQTVSPVVVTLTLDRQDSVCNTGTEVSCGVEACAGCFTEDECGNHNSKTPGNGDLDGTCTVHTGLLKINVCNNTVTQKDEQHGAYKFSKAI